MHVVSRHPRNQPTNQAYNYNRSKSLMKCKSKFATHKQPKIYKNAIPCVHPVVDQRVEHGVGHGQPVEAEVDVLDEGLAHDLLVVVRVDEVDVVGQPADGEDDHDDDEHLHDLAL